jgi:AraC-like DNA-binding protein
VLRIATMHEFVEAPIGRWAQASPLLAWAATPKLCGLVYTGHIGNADVPNLRALGGLPLHPSFERPYRAILDCGGVTGMESAAFAYLVEHSREIASTGPLIERVAYVLPAGMPGATALGVFHQHVAPIIDMRFVDSLEIAIDVVEADEFRAEIVELREIAQGRGLLESMRAILREDPRLTLAVVAARLGVSTRTLQRACMNAGSSYRDETATARFAFADELLRSSKDKIEVIARRAGYASATSFARRFRDTYGISPAQFRDQPRTK